MSTPTDLPSAARAFLDDAGPSVANLLHFLQEAGRDLDAERVKWIVDRAEEWAAAGDENGCAEQDGEW